jgi:peptidoglycan/xylan/chitin deacetylase (PgdA/CDA1 family)
MLFAPRRCNRPGALALLLSCLALIAVVFLLSCQAGAVLQFRGEPIVAMTFDDGDSSVYTVAFPRMRALDSAWTATHFLPISYINTPTRVTLDELHEMERAGWETGGHGMGHTNLSSLSPDSAEAEIERNYQWLADSGLAHESFAYAWGDYNPSIESAAKRYFRNIRTAHDFDYLAGVNRTALGYFAAQGGHTADDLIGRVEQARQRRSPLVIICFHAIIPDTAAPPVGIYWCRESAVAGFFRYLKKQELPVLSVRDAMTTLMGD